jgi:predicted deacetylase
MITCITFDDVSLDYLSLKELRMFLAFLKRLDVCTTLFVVPNRTEHGEGQEMTEFAQCLRDASDSGHELAQHGNFHSGNEYFSEFGCLLPLPYPAYEQQKRRIEMGVKEFTRLTGLTPNGFRAPFYLHNAITLAALSNLGFKYDSSKTIFKPAHCSRARLRVMSILRPFRLQGVLEVPVTGDYTYKLNDMGFSSSLDQALRDFESVRSQDGVFVLNNHPNRIDLKVLFTFLRTFVAKVSCKSDFVRLKDVERFYQ